LNDDELAEGDGLGGAPVATAPGSTTPGAGGPMFGTLESPCGEAPEGFTPTASDEGVTEDGIKLAVISDITGFMKVPTASVAESTQAFVQWCNALGGINGRQIELQLFDSQIVGQFDATVAACSAGVFAIVGSGS